MRKFLLIGCICVSFLVQAQNYPTQGNWNFGISPGFGLLRYGQALSLTGVGRGISQVSYSGIAVLGAEKHFNKITSLHIELGTFVAESFQVNLSYLSLIPSIKVPSKNRFIFSSGVRFPIGVFSEDGEREPILGLGPQFRFKWLMGDKRLYNKVYMGDFSIIIEHFIFQRMDTKYVGVNNQIRIQLTLPLSK